MANVFDNLKLLKKDMETKGWVIDSFYFNYKNQNYIILVKLFEENEQRTNKYALLKLEFLKEDNFADNLLIEVNSVKLFVDTVILRKYLGVEYVENLGDFAIQFNEYFAKFIPTAVINNKTESQKDAMIRSLNKSDPEDPRRIYCYAVKRNPEKSDGTLGQRSPYNDNKTKLRRPSLYARLGADPNLSFQYSMEASDEKSDEKIIANWTKNQ